MSGGGGQMQWVEHDARAAVLAELHARPFLPLEVPRRIYHFAFVTGTVEAAADRAAVEELARAKGVAPPPPDAKFHYFTFGDWDLRWEQHTEFTTYSWSTGADAATPLAQMDPRATGEIAFCPPGPLIVASQLAVVDRARSVEELAGLLDSQSLCVIGAGKGCTEVLTDFALDANGYTRFIIRIEEAPPIETGRIAQRVLEVETYRTMALLGLPLARAVTPELSAMEQELSGIIQALSQGDSRTNHDLLQHLSDLLAKSEALSNRTGFRFSASRAYRALVRSRLDLLQEAKEGQHVTISNFLNARFDPAIETCNAVEARQLRFSNDVERAANLMRTGVNLEMERQNSKLLDDMVRRTRLQMRLSHMVRGISVAALSYYLTGLFAYLVKGAKEAGLLPKVISPEVATALAVPLVVLIAAGFMARVNVLSKRAAKEEQVE